MDGGDFIIGLPEEDGTGTVRKYFATGHGHSKPKEMDELKQTLMSTSIVQEDGNTVMEFTKYMVEPGEHPILATGDNTFIYALGNTNALTYHGTNKNSVTVDFDTTREPTPTSNTTDEAPEQPPEEDEAPTPDPPSGAMTMTKVGTVILGAGAAMAALFGL